jgi:hypothetical protein
MHALTIGLLLTLPWVLVGVIYSGKRRALAQRFAGAGAGAYQAQQQASGQVYRTGLRRHTLASVDRFWLLALGGAVMVAVSLRLKRYDPRTGGQVGVL